LLLQCSCIDRDTIAGTGKETPDSMISSGGGGQTGAVNTKLTNPVKVRILAENGRPVRGIIVEFTVENSNATFSDTTATTDGNGYAQTYVTLGQKADSVRIYAAVLGLKGSPVKFTMFSITSGPARVELMDGNNQVGFAGSAFSNKLKLRVWDSYNNVVPNVAVYFSTLNGKILPATAISDSSGMVAAVWTSDTLVGTKSAQALVPSIQNGTVNFTARTVSLSVPKTMQRISSDTFYMLQAGKVNGLLVVKVLDKYGNPLYLNPPAVYQVQFSVIQGAGTVFPAASGTNSSGIATAGVELAMEDSVMVIQADAGNGIPKLNFTIYGYKYSQIDSLSSSGGSVTVYWQKNLNPNFANYTLQRCISSSFDNTTKDLQVITDENVNSASDNTAVVGTSPFYRIKVSYTNGFYFYSNIRDVLVNP
ncbi:MAG: Ig-like domain-containing protein, partial [Bacteroidota bacterium]